MPLRGVSLFKMPSWPEPQNPPIGIGFVSREFAILSDEVLTRHRKVFTARALESKPMNHNPIRQNETETTIIVLNLEQL
jgi:hypothetical protein